MLEFQEKRKIKRYLYSRVTLVILLIFIAFLLNAVWGVYKKQSLTRDNFLKISSNFNELQAREKMLTGEINKLKTEDGTEEEIREKYGLIKPGEEVIMMVDKSGSTSSDDTVSNVGFWQKVKDWFR